jgi:hypothetical protein
MDDDDLVTALGGAMNDPAGRRGARGAQDRHRRR